MIRLKPRTLLTVAVVIAVLFVLGRVARPLLA
jgi:hypothetical protein